MSQAGSAFPTRWGRWGVPLRRLLRSSAQKRAALAVPCPGQPLVQVELRSPGAPITPALLPTSLPALLRQEAQVFLQHRVLCATRREGAAALRAGPARNSCRPAVNGTPWTSCQVPSGSQCPGGRPEKARGLPGLQDKGVGPRPDPSARLGSISHRCFPRTALSLPETKRKW